MESYDIGNYLYVHYVTPETQYTGFRRSAWWFTHCHQI